MNVAVDGLPAGSPVTLACAMSSQAATNGADERVGVLRAVGLFGSGHLGVEHDGMSCPQRGVGLRGLQHACVRDVA